MFRAANSEAHARRKQGRTHDGEDGGTRGAASRRHRRRRAKPSRKALHKIGDAIRRRPISGMSWERAGDQCDISPSKGGSGVRRRAA